MTSKPEPSKSSHSTNYSQSVSLLKWDGNQEDFAFYMDRLRIRAEREMVPYREPSAICIDLIDTLLEDKKPRVASWFS